MADFITEFLIAAILFVAPGLALLLGLLPRLEHVDWFERLSLSAGLSLAIYPILLLWARVIGNARLGAFVLWTLLGFCVLLIVWRLRHRPEARRAVHTKSRGYSLVLLTSAGLVLGLRLWAVRGLTAPLWGDSVQHAIIAQLIVENGGLFDSWLPYAPYHSFTVHFGFHTAVAAFQWATGMEAARATLLVGQIINALAVFTIYPLAMRVAGYSRWAGVGTLWAVGLLSPTPGFYVNWGRYPQLAGQAILPVTLYMTIAALDSRRGHWRLAVLAGIASAGMSLAYYRMPYYYAAFVLIWLAGYLYRLRWDGRKWLVAMTRLAVLGSVAAALLVPWVGHISGSELAQGVVRSATATTPPLRRVLADYQDWAQSTSYLSRSLLLVITIATIWSIVRRQWAVTAVGLWIVGLAALPAGRLIHLPGAAHINTFAVLIALYIPVGILVGWLFSEAVSWLLSRYRTLGYITIVLMLMLSLGWGVRQQVNIVDPDYVMVTESDLAAMDWIRTNTAEDSRFLVNGFLINRGRSAVGADAGWWIPLLAGRRNTMPPQYALLNELPIDPSYNQDVVNLVARLQEVPLSSSEGQLILCQQDISHVYIGQGQGRIGLGAIPLYSPGDLSANPAFSPLYHQNQVWVFTFDRSTCPSGVDDPSDAAP